MLPAPAKFLQKKFVFGGIFYFSTMVAQNLLLKHTTKQELPLRNRLERLFHELDVVCCSQELKRQVSGVSLPAGQFFTRAQIPSCIFVDVWPIDLILGILVEE